MKYLITIITVAVLTAGTFSQSYITGYSWSMGFPVGKTSDYISAASFTGFSIEGHRMFKKNLSFGLMAGWNILNEKTSDEITVNNTTITGAQGRYINVFPLLVSASVYLNNNRASKFVPFLRAHVGTYYILQRFDIGVYTFNNDNWHFGVAPELGAIIKINQTIGILINGRYNYAFDSGTRLSGDETNDYSFISANIGVSYSR